MPKQLITLIGVLVSLAVIALGVFAVALPLYLQSVTTQADTASVAETNALYQQQIDHLEEQEAHSDEINQSVAALRGQIPGTAQSDDVFELVANAATASGATVTSITAGDVSPFTARTGATAVGEVDPAEPPAPDATEPAADPAVTTQDLATTAPAPGRNQVDYTILVTVPDMNAATAFIDALRSGPRLLSPISATVLQTGSGIDVQVSALAFISSEG